MIPRTWQSGEPRTTRDNLIEYLKYHRSYAWNFMTRRLSLDQRIDLGRLQHLLPCKLTSGFDSSVLAVELTRLVALSKHRGCSESILRRYINMTADWKDNVLWPCWLWGGSRSLSLDRGNVAYGCADDNKWQANQLSARHAGNSFVTLSRCANAPLAKRDI
jgi:hypothetical protein